MWWEGGLAVLSSRCPVVSASQRDGDGADPGSGLPGTARRVRLPHGRG